MRTLDRYIARSFIEPFAVSLSVILGLIVVAEAFGRLEEFTRMADTLGQAFSRMGRIYLLRLPTFIAPVLPIAMLIGASFGISQLNGRNELIAMRASGVSVWRIIAPVYALAVVLSFAGMANCEYVIPRAEEATGRDMARWTGKDESVQVAIPKEEEDTLFTLAYNRASREARSFSITQRATGVHIQAETAQYKDGAWRLKNVTRGDERLPELDWETSLTPREIELEIMDPQLAPLSVLKRLIRRDGDHPNPRYVLLYHDRLAYPFTGLVLVGIGLPFVIAAERIRRSRMLGVGVCLAICAVFYTVRFIASDLGQSGHLSPALAAWLPIVIFGALGLYLLETLHN